MACVSDGACEGQALETALRTGLDGKPVANYADHGRGTRPVVGASWYDAQRFVGWLNARAGGDIGSSQRPNGNMRRAPERQTAFPWGEHPTTTMPISARAKAKAWAARPKDAMSGSTTPRRSGSFPANAFGLYDMHGNTYEWAEDCYQKDALLLPTDGSAVQDGNCNVRVMRSTSFTSNPKTLRSANRAGQYPPNLRGRNYLGFRVARTLAAELSASIAAWP